MSSLESERRSRNEAGSASRLTVLLSFVKKHGWSMGGAIGLTLGSRALGLFREGLIVGKIGVHDYTDGYFAVSSLIIWLNNWAFGAFALGFLPRYASLSLEARRKWYRSLQLWLGGIGVLAGGLFFALFHQIERLMLGGRTVLGVGPALALAVCIPITISAGLANSRLVATPQGIVRAAGSQLIANVVALTSLFAMIVTRIDPSIILPIALLVTQGGLLVCVTIAQRDLEAPVAAAPEARPSRAGAGQLAATTVENIGFNLNVVAQQAIAGSLISGAVTMNAYAVRLILIPFTGAMGPVQQRLFVRFTSSSSGTRTREVRLAVIVGLALGLAVGCVLSSLLVLSRPHWSAEWQTRFAEHRYALTLLAYGVYAGVVFCCQTLARFAFSSGRGWWYTVVMICAYAIGTSAKFVMAPRLGILALPLCALIAEMGGALVLLFVLRVRAVSSRAIGAASEPVYEPAA